jgi:hypothetical protein
MNPRKTTIKMDRSAYSSVGRNRICLASLIRIVMTFQRFVLGQNPDILSADPKVSKMLLHVLTVDIFAMFPLSLVSTTEEILDRKVAAPV